MAKWNIALLSSGRYIAALSSLYAGMQEAGQDMQYRRGMELKYEETV